MRVTTRLFVSLGLVCAFAAVGMAGTVDNFDPANPAVTATQAGSVPGPVVTGGGPTGNFLRLINDGVNNQRNQYTYDRTDPGQFSTVVAEFDFSGFSADQPADGFAVSLIPTATYGVSGPGPNLGESPNAAGTMGVGFRTYSGATNNVRLHWDNQEYSNVGVPMGTASFRDASWNHAKLTIQQIGPGSNVTMELTGAGGTDTPIRQYVPDLLPFDSRLQFSGRTGGANMTADVDNVNVQYSSPYVAPPTVGGAETHQDFDSLGGTPSRTVQWGSTPGPWLHAGGPTGNFLRLINDGVGGQNNRIAFDRAADGALSNYALTSTFDFRGKGTIGGTADGFSIAFMPTSGNGDTGAGNAFGAEEPNQAGMFAVGFDLYPNINEVSLHWNNAAVAANNIPTAQIDLDANVFHRAQIVATPAAGGANVSVTLIPDVHGTPGTPVTVFDNQFIAGIVPYDYRVAFTGRTGGAHMDVDLDNISVTRAAVAQAGTDTTQDFDSVGSAYIASTHGSATRPQIVNEGGNNLLRLVNPTGGQDNVLAFDRTAAGAYQRVEASFDMRIASGADGGAIALLNTGDYGTDGPGPASGPFPGGDGWEEANVAHSFAVGFDIYNNIQEVSLHWDGAVVANIASPFNYRDSGLNPVDLVVDYIPGGANVSLSIAGNAVYTNQFVPGMSPYESRVALGGRTGGVTTTMDVDNIDVKFLNAVAAPAGPFDWKGQTGDYTDATKWVGGAVPTGNDNATIGLGICNASSLNVQGTGSLTVSGLGILNNGGVLRVGAGGVAGTLNQTGGGIGATGDLYVADGGSSGSTYTMTGGMLTVGGQHTVIGRGGVGHMSVDGADTVVNLRRLFVAEFGGSAGSTFTMNDGTLNIANSDDLGIQVGRTESAAFTQNGGGVNVDARVHLGQDAGAVGTYNMNGGALTLGSYLVLGSNGKGVVNQTAGAITSGNRTILGDQPGSEGVYNLSGGSLTCNGLTIADKASKGTFTQTGGDVVVHGRLAIVDDANGEGSYSISDGTLLVDGDYFIVGRQGPGHFTQTGGIVTANLSQRLLLADIAGAGGSTYSISDGELNVLGGREISIGKSGEGTFTQTGGVVNASGNVRLGEGANVGTYRLQGGELNAATLLKNGPSVFDFTGGRLSAGAVEFDLANNGGTTAPDGTMTVTGTYTQAAGAALEIDLAGPGSADVLAVNGPVNLDGTLDLLFSYDVAEMDTFVILANDDSDPINGTFAGLPEGSIFYVPSSAYPLRITYFGGSMNNDVQITAVPEPLTLLSLLAGSAVVGGYVRRRRKTA